MRQYEIDAIENAMYLAIDDPNNVQARRIVELVAHVLSIYGPKNFDPLTFRSNTLRKPNQGRIE